MLSNAIKLDFDDSFNCENRLVKILSETQKLEFVYDYKGRRVSKQVFAKDNGVWTLTTHKKFVYNKYKLIKEIDALTDTIKQRFTWLGDNLLSLHENNENYLYIADGNKNICQLVNLSDGTITNKYDYTPFGKLAQTVEEIEQAFKFSSEYAETETNLIYYNYRYYNPENGKWLSRDPIEEYGGINIYGFVNNNSANYIDYFGLGLGDWIMTGNWNPSQTELNAAYRGWSDRFRPNPFTFTDPDATTLTESYTGKKDPTDEEWNAAMDGAAEAINCFKCCMKREHKKILTYATSLITTLSVVQGAPLGHKKSLRWLGKLNTLIPGVKKPLVRVIIGGGADKWGSPLRGLAQVLRKVRMTKSAVEFSKQADVMKKAIQILKNSKKAAQWGKLAKTGKVLKAAGQVAIMAAAIAEIHFANKCRNECSKK